MQWLDEALRAWWGHLPPVAIAALMLLLTPGCASSGERRAEERTTSSPLHLQGQRVLVLPLQRLVGLSYEARERVDAEVLFALNEREGGAIWISPAELQRALRRSPGFAGNPESLPSDPILQHREPRVGELMAGELRRYSALVDTRLVLLLREARFTRGEATAEGSLRLGAALLDSRSGRVLWWGEAAGNSSASPGPLVIASAAAALAERLLAVPEREPHP